MTAESLEPLLACVCGFVVSLIAVAASFAYASRRGLLDLPGRRRSHTQPTPRGGGIGIVVAVLVCALPVLSLGQHGWAWSTTAALAMALLAVAAVGWRDDHAPLPVVPRLCVHGLAALLVGMVLLAPIARTHPVMWVGLLIVVPVIAGSINAHNFMDGIDGLLGLQGLFVFAGYALLAQASGQFALCAAALAAAAACCGFLVFNLPPARIFMGDVGSGVLGLLIAVFAGLLLKRVPQLFWACAILSSAFLVDAALTLLRRVLAGVRWYTAHREHLYQWMVRAGLSHAQTDGLYMLWNLIIAAPLAWAAVCWPHADWALCAVTYALACAIWLTGKHACLRAIRRGGRHALA